MTGSASVSDEKTAWNYAFIILLLVSVAMLALRLTGRQFLVAEFEIALVYFPTILSGLIVAAMKLK